MIIPYLPGTAIVCVNVKGRRTRDNKPLTDGLWYVHAIKRHHRETYLYSLISNEGRGVGSIPHRCIRVVNEPHEVSLSYTAALTRWL